MRDTVYRIVVPTEINGYRYDFESVQFIESGKDSAVKWMIATGVASLDDDKWYVEIEELPSLTDVAIGTVGVVWISSVLALSAYWSGVLYRLL